jgi:hypothetical protein
MQAPRAGALQHRDSFSQSLDQAQGISQHDLYVAFGAVPSLASPSA